MKRVLFIGNSFTYYNDMPLLFEQLSNDAGFDVHAVSVIKGGWYLNQFADPENDMGKELRSVYPRHQWDYIVLQDQSFNPAGNPEDFLNSVQSLRTLMPNGRLVFYQTWPYEANTAKLASVNISYEDMYTGLRNAYTMAARVHDGILVPVGDGFHLIQQRKPEFSLYMPDAFHPNLAGSYLAACLFFGCLSGQSPLTLSTPKKLDASKAQFLREVAQELLTHQGGI